MMKRTKIISLCFAVAVCFVSASCQIVEKIINPVKKERKIITTKVYEKNGLSFSYPDNWKVTEDSILEEGSRYINVEDADDSLLIITLFGADSYVDLNEYVENFEKNLSANIPVGKIIHGTMGETSRVIKGQNYNGKRYKYSISLAGENMPHTTDFFSIDGEKLNGVIMIQAPDEDWKATEKEFQVIFDSIKF